MSFRTLLLAAVTSILAIVFIAQLPTAMGAACPTNYVNDGYITLTGSNALIINAATTTSIAGKSFTVMCWIRRSRNYYDEAMFSYGDLTTAPSTNQNFFFSIESGQNYYGRTGFWWAVTFDYSSLSVGIWKDSALIASSYGTLSNGQYAGGSQPLNIGGPVGTLQYRFAGDIDEFRMYSTALSAATIAIHYSGLWRDQLANCMLWYKFNEASGSFHYDSCNINNNNLAFWSGTAGQTANTVNPNCLPGYWEGFYIYVATPYVRIGGTATIYVAQADNGGNPMWTYPSMGTTSVSLNVIGTGTALPQGLQLLSLSNGYAVFTFTGNKPETVTFTLTDTLPTGRIVTIVSPTVTLLAPDVSSVILYDSDFTGLPLAFTPTFSYLSNSYTGAAVPFRSSTVGLKATFSYTATIAINSVDYGALTSGVEIILPLVAAPSLNAITITSSELGTFYYYFTVKRRSPDLSSLVMTPTPAFSDTGLVFVAGSFGSWNVGVGGQLSQLLVTMTFTVGNITATVNGVSFGPVTSGTPFDVSSALVTTGANAVVVTSPQDGGSYTYTVDIGCPFPLVCNPAAANVVSSLCEFECQYCDINGIYRRVCLQQRPSCCATPGCPC